MTGRHGGAPRGRATPLSLEERAQVLTTVLDRLGDSNSSIVATPERVAQLQSQVTAVLDDVDAELSGRATRFAPRLSNEIGVSRASNRILPVESLHAAQLLFEAAVTVVVRARPEWVTPITVSLHRSIMERLGRAASAYVDFLIQRVQGAEHAERKRLARELHDRAAHGVGVALQCLDLFEIDSQSHPERADNRMRAARQAMHDAIDSIRTIATELRDTLGDRDLREAVANYLTRFAPSSMRSTVEVTGDPALLTDVLAEELYLVLREAVHNALLHADATTIDVRIEILPFAVTAVVADDGIGFDPAHTDGIGLNSMRERLELLGGTLEVTSVAGRGVGVRAVIPTRSGIS